MHEKTLIEFISKYLVDQDFRCRVLHKEKTVMTREFHLDDDQYIALISLDKAKIQAMMIEEFKMLGGDLDRIREDIWGPNGRPPSHASSGAGSSQIEAAPLAVLAALTANSAYEEGKIHIRKRRPVNIEKNKKTEVVVMGQGFHYQHGKITVYFVRLDDSYSGGVEGLPDGEQVKGTVTGCSCGIDVFQRVKVDVKLTTEGQWQIFAQNTDDLDLTEWSEVSEKSWIRVLA